MDEYSADRQRLTELVLHIEKLRLKRKRDYPRHPGGKRFSQDELCNSVYPSYKNMLVGRTQRLPDRAALLQIADYLECSSAERNELLQAAQYAPINAPDVMRRKQITVIVGSIFLSPLPDLDLEDSIQTMQHLKDRLEQIIASHHGVISEFTGNFLIALWSTETTLEDDPEQAIRAAIAIQSELKAFHGEGSFGIHTGRGLLQSTGEVGQFHVAGEVVNRAAQLAQLGTRGGILISNDTYALLYRRYAIVPVNTPTEFQVYRVERNETGNDTLRKYDPHDPDAPFIGRTAELADLQETLKFVSNSRKLQIVTLVAEAGIGKSRLLYEFDSRVLNQDAKLLKLKGRAQQSGQETPYSLLRSLLSSHFEIAENDFAEVVRKKIEHGIAAVTDDYDTAQKAAYIIAHLLSFNFSDNQHIRGFSHDALEFFEMALAQLGHYFQALAGLHKIVVILEDLHWADESSLGMFSRMSALLGESPILLLCTARYDDSTLPLRLGTNPSAHKTVKLSPLTQQESHELIAGLLVGGEPIPENLGELIVNSSNGNPLYIEELVKLLIENGTLFKQAQTWLVNQEQLASVLIPNTLTALLQARFDNLPASQQLILQLASVVGRVFWDGSLKSLLAHANADLDSLALMRIIDTLHEQNLIFRQTNSTFRGYTEYTFKHALFCNVIYETILKHNRLSYHAAIANWLIGVASRNQRLEEKAGLIAYHLKCANNNEEAFKWYRRAGKAAAARFANAEALINLTCALNLLPTSRENDQYALLTERERVHDALGLRDAQASDLQAMYQLASSMGNVYFQVETLVRQTNYAYLMGQSNEVASQAQEAIRLAESIGAYEYQASSYVMLGNALWDQGYQEKAHACYEQALRLSDMPAQNQ